MTTLGTYFDFWSKALGVSIEEMSSTNNTISIDGRYLARHNGRYVYLFRDLHLGKCIFTAKKEYFDDLETNFEKDFETVHLPNDDSEIERILLQNKASPTFCDIDYCLPLREFNYQANDLCIRPLKNQQASGLQEFLNAVTEEERDILDLNFEGEFAFGLYQGGHLQGVCRSVQVRDTQIADITVLVAETARGKGFGKSLVSSVVDDVLNRNLVPKYRVEENNQASRRVAEQLGFVPRFRIKAWEVLQQG
jgi:GNAT superfamily N-acetyltransferase